MSDRIRIPASAFTFGQRVLCTWHEAECAPTEAWISSIDYDFRRNGDKPRYTITEDNGSRTDDISEGMLTALVNDDRAAALSRCQSGRAMRRFDLKLSSVGVIGLLRIANAAKGRFKRADLTASGAAGYRLTGEDLNWLIERGHLKESGPWIEITDQGNELVRAVVAFAEMWEGGAK